MTSSSDRVLRQTQISERHYRIGDAVRGMPAPVDNRPYTVQEAEKHHASELDQIRDRHQSALEEAYQNGYRDGSAMSQSTMTQHVDRLTQLIESLADQFARTRIDWFAENEKQAVELVCVALEHILGERPAVRSQVERALQKAFEQLDSGDRATVRCNPDDLTFVEKVLKRPLDQFNGFRKIKVLADDQIGVGGCMVETELGVVDARVEKQMAILKSALLQHTRTRQDNVAVPDVSAESN